MKSLKTNNTVKKMYVVSNQFYFGIAYNNLNEAKNEMKRLNEIRNKFCYHIDVENFINFDKK